MKVLSKLLDVFRERPAKALSTRVTPTIQLEPQGGLQFVLTAIPENGRLEAEISYGCTKPVAILYEASDGWHFELSDQSFLLDQYFIEEVKREMRQYPNRTGEKLPEDIHTRGELSLWLIAKDDGTAMGMPYSVEPH